MELDLGVGSRIALIERLKMRAQAGHIYVSLHLQIKDRADIISGIEKASSGG